LLREFERDYNDFLSEGPAAVIERFAKVSSYAYGKRVRVSNGRENFTGTTAGIGPEGLLLVKRDNGQVMTVIAGDVTEAL
jgi:BirA family biotin operon repressor/biotin-[acetyl-CoA-carboxylase] ligase